MSLRIRRAAITAAAPPSMPAMRAGSRIDSTSRSTPSLSSAKSDSVEICFVPDGDHASLIRRRRPELATAGAIRDSSGNILGEHDGYERFTIGQRKGLGIATGQRRFVLDIIPETREVIVGDP